MQTMLHAKTYHTYASVQNTAAAILMDMMSIAYGHCILDLGCGSGGITHHLAHMTSGQVVGKDASLSLIAEAKKKFIKSNLRFEVEHVEDLTEVSIYHWIFSNSALHRYLDQKLIISYLYHALVDGGRAAIQVPWTKNWCPVLNEIMQRLLADVSVGLYLTYFKAPWFFYEQSMQVDQYFSEAGFTVERIIPLRMAESYSADKFIHFFKSTLAMAYFDPNHYDCKLPPDFEQRLMSALHLAVKDYFADNVISIDCNRLFLMMRK